VPLGSVKKIAVCGTGSAIVNSGRVSKCADGTTLVSQTAYIIDPVNASAFEEAFKPFDYTFAGQVFAMSFSMVVGLYAVSRGFGTILSFIRRG